MMKGLATRALVLLALGILFAGCAAPSSQESSVNPSPGNSGVEGVPMTLDPANHSLTIGDGSGGYSFRTWDGHSVEFLNGTTACVNDGTGNSKCSIRLYNRDSRYYMANAFMVFTRCDSCDLTNHIMDNFDVGNIDNNFWDAAGNPKPLDAYTVHPPTTWDGDYAGGATPIFAIGKGSGIAYASDTYTNEVPIAPHNPFGAPLVDLPFSARKPAWMIGPKCGYGSEVWDFGGSSLAWFGFYVAVRASWFQMKPLGDDGAIGGTGVNADDPRFNFQYYTTAYLTLTDLYSPTSDSGHTKFYRPGSIYRSNVLAGYKPSWARGTAGKSVADINFTGGQKYFAVNIGVEASDRMESQSFGLKSNPVYEYYAALSFMISWNPAVLTHLDGSLPVYYLTKNGGTRIQVKANSQCHIQTNCGNFNNSLAQDMQFNKDWTVIGGGAIDRGGYIVVGADNMVHENSAFWSYFNSSDYYSYWNGTVDSGSTVVLGDGGDGVGGGAGAIPPPRTIPKTFFMRGFAKIRCMTANNSTCVQQDGPDADPEIWFANVVLKVKPYKIGLGTEIKVDTFQSETYLSYFQSFDGFDTTPSPEPLSNVTNAGPMRISDQAAFTVTNGADTIIGAPQNYEYPNPKIRHRGPAAGYGSYQGWDVAVCIK